MHCIFFLMEVFRNNPVRVEHSFSLSLSNTLLIPSEDVALSHERGLLHNTSWGCITSVSRNQTKVFICCCLCCLQAQNLVDLLQWLFLIKMWTIPLDYQKPISCKNNSFMKSLTNCKWCVDSRIGSHFYLKSVVYY